MKVVKGIISKSNIDNCDARGGVCPAIALLIGKYVIGLPVDIDLHYDHVTIYNTQTDLGGDFEEKKFEQAIEKFFEENY